MQNDNNRLSLRSVHESSRSHIICYRNEHGEGVLIKRNKSKEDRLFPTLQLDLVVEVDPVSPFRTNQAVTDRSREYVAKSLRRQLACRTETKMTFDIVLSHIGTAGEIRILD